MVLVEAITPRGGTSTRGKNPPQGGQHTGHAPTTGGHTTPRGARRGAPHRGGHQHTGGSLPPANTPPTASPLLQQVRDAVQRLAVERNQQKLRLPCCSSSSISIGATRSYWVPVIIEP